jgi:Tol biopolymer transport system component
MRTTTFQRATAFLLVALVCTYLTACGGGTNGTTNAGTTTVAVPAPQASPVVTSVTPEKAVAGGTSFDIEVTGSGFAVASVVLWNGSPRPASVGFSRDAAHLSGHITAADIAAAGVAKIAVQNPATATATATQSNTVDLLVSALHLNSVTPPWVTQGSGDTVLVLTGAGFVPGTLVQWNGIARPTIVVSSSTLNVTIPATELAAANLAEITVVTPTPNAEESNLVLFPIVGSGNTIDRITVGNDASAGSFRPAVNRDGSIVAYAEEYTSTGFTIFLHNTCLNADASCVPSGQVVSIGLDGQPIKLTSWPTAPVMSADGRFVAFASNPFGFSTSTLSDVILRDTCSGVSECSPSTFVPRPNVAFTTFKSLPSLSADGRYVAFTGGESEGYGFDTATPFIFDTCRGATGTCQPLATSDITDESAHPLKFAQTSSHSISANGRYVAFIGDADPNYGNDYLASSTDLGIWLKDTCAGATAACTPSSQRISIAADGTVIHSPIESVAVSGDGRYVAFVTLELNGGVLLRDTCLGATSACVPATIRVSVNSSGKLLRGSGSSVSISDDGRRVVFALRSSFDIYSQTETSEVLMRDTCIGATTCVPGTVLLSQAQNGTLANGPSYAPMISADGRFVVFESRATNLVSGDTNGLSDIFRVSTQP